MSATDRPPFEPIGNTENGPVFGEAWHAQVLALAHTLSHSGMFTPSEWSDAIGEELRHAADGGAADDQETYYGAVLRSLERLISTKGVPSAALSERVEAWRRAYLNTPHGRPVELSAGVARAE